jgi:hypothetical protein
MTDDRLDLSRMTDRDMIELFLANVLMRRATGQDEKDGTTDFTTRLEPVLVKCLDNMKRVDELTSKVINLSENLAIEKMSNRRMRDLITDAATLLHGPPACYPAPLNELVARIQKEVAP